jgi:rhodanese-related sulfurtransferase
VLYCESGVRTQQAIARMKENGFKRVLHLEGDMAKWREAKRPVAHNQ